MSHRSRPVWTLDSDAGILSTRLERQLVGRQGSIAPGALLAGFWAYAVRQLHSLPSERPLERQPARPGQRQLTDPEGSFEPRPAATGMGRDHPVAAGAQRSADQRRADLQGEQTLKGRKVADSRRSTQVDWCQPGQDAARQV
jgi:hypothetical protein